MFFWILLAVALVGSATAAPSDIARSIAIYRDSWGVPHIYAKTDAGAAFGLMYAQAEDNFWQLEQVYIRILGRSAEVEGTRGIANDLLYRAYEVEKRIRDAYARATPKIRALCDGFAGGVNLYLEKHPDVKPRLLTHWEPWFILAEEMRGPAGTGITAAERARAFPMLAGAAAPTETGGDPDE